MRNIVDNYADIGVREYARLLHDCIVELGRVRMVAFGNSMRPAIVNRDKLTIERCDFDALTIGDVVFFVQADYQIHKIHRVIAKLDGFLITKGDNCQHEDFPVLPNEVVGRVVNIPRTRRIV